MAKNRPLTGFLMGILLLGLFSGCVNTEEVQVYQYQVVQEFPHDNGAFTQGLVWNDGYLYEGTGLYGGSSLRKVELTSGQVLQQLNLPASFFGEGITIFEDKIYQLTWKAQTGFIYDRATFGLLATFNYEHEGWGITHDGKYLIISDGTSLLHFIDPQTLTEVKQIEVRDDGEPVLQINELEYINDRIYANIWQTDRIVIIDPQTGRVIGWIELTGILSPQDQTEETNVLNGIAYDEKQDRLWVTGKLWPKLFQIEIINID
mgnify:CR=1 FL=1